MGPKVLNVTVSDATHSIRAYAHCSSRKISTLIPEFVPVSGGVSLLLLNLNAMNVTVTLPRLLAGVDRVEFALTVGSGGNGGQSMRLNGAELVYHPMKLPALAGASMAGTVNVTLTPQSAVFMRFSSALSICD